MFTLPCECEKSQIAEFVKHEGKWNSTPFRVGDATHPVRSLVFRGFVGMLDIESRKYRGILGFEPLAGGDECPTIDFAAIGKPASTAASGLPQKELGEVRRSTKPADQPEPTKDR
jgi:hypothetical protein